MNATKLSLLLMAVAAVGGTVIAVQAETPPKLNNAKEVGDSEERTVKAVTDARKAYQDSLLKLHEVYTKSGEKERAKWVEDELRGYHLAPKPAYHLGDVPPAKLEAKENIKEANELYRQAMTYKDKGFGSEYTLNQRRAEMLFQEILEKYRTSDKIADVAYELGDLYESRAYKQYARAALYYERSSQWRKGGRIDSRMRAAKLYDKQLGDRAKAIELYRDVVAHDTDHDRIKDAEKRLAELTGTKR
ncbi:hypothetical protein BH11PLA2_BH11PLA2_08020 [soil metagenome]